MAKTKITQVMMDDSTLNVNKEVDMVFSIANTLRGPYKADKYKDIIIPMIIIRRLECALATKDASGKTRKQKVTEAFKKNPKTPQQVLERLAGYPFYNTSDFDLAGLLDEAPECGKHHHQRKQKGHEFFHLWKISFRVCAIVIPHDICAFCRKRGA